MKGNALFISFFFFTRTCLGKLREDLPIKGAQALSHEGQNNFDDVAWSSLYCQVMLASPRSNTFWCNEKTENRRGFHFWARQSYLLFRIWYLVFHDANSRSPCSRHKVTVLSFPHPLFLHVTVLLGFYSQFRNRLIPYTLKNKSAGSRKISSYSMVGWNWLNFAFL